MTDRRRDAERPRTGGPDRRGRYHHGDLPAALVEVGVEVLAETGLSGFSVAAIARRIGVSTGAPYRHFADRDRLLVAVATRVAGELAARLRAATADAGDARAELVAAAAAYVDFVRAHRVGFDVIYAPALRPLRDTELADAGREVMSLLFLPAHRLRGDPTSAMRLVEQIVVLAHGYATLDADGFLTEDRLTEEATSARAARAAAAVIDGG